jgi:hypothetical protein
MRRLVLLLLPACIGGDGQRPPDEGPDAAQGACADDGVFEPNDTVAMAWPTPVGKTRDSIAISNLAICPATDVDHYGVVLSVPRSLAARVTWAGGSPVTLAILDGAGTPLVVGSPGNVFQRVCIPNAPAGSYVPVVQTGDGSTSATYQLAIDLVPSC